MKASVTLKAKVALLLDLCGYLRWKIKRRSIVSCCFILMYHRIVPFDRACSWLQAGMYVEPRTFQDHLQILREYAEVVPLERVLRHCLERTLPPDGKPLCALTFDDGWRDFHDYAFPALKAAGMPATVFLPTDYIGSEKWFWTDRFSHILSRGNIREALSNQAALSELSGLSRNGEVWEAWLEKAIGALKAYRDEEIEGLLAELATVCSSSPAPAGRAFLSWEEAREMYRSGLVSFGSHTAGHHILTLRTDDQIQRELLVSKERLLAEGVADTSFVPFCYPNGDHTETIAGMVAEAGYSLAVTTRSGWNGLAADPYRLGRVAVHQDMTATPAMFKARVAGLF